MFMMHMQMQMQMMMLLASVDRLVGTGTYSVPTFFCASSKKLKERERRSCFRDDDHLKFLN